MQFIFQHQPPSEQPNNSQPGFFERLQSAQGAVGRSLDDEQKQGQGFIKRARDIVDQQDQNRDTYEQSLKLIQKTGLNEEEAQKVLDDPINPYITDFMDFVERMDINGTKFVDFSENGTFIFNDLQGSAGGINYSSGAVERALKWGSVIYPNLKAVSQGFRYSLVEKAIADKTPAMDKFIGDLALGYVIGAGEREAVREELRKLNSGETILADKNDERDEELDALKGAESEGLTVREIRDNLPERQMITAVAKSANFNATMTPYDLKNILQDTNPLLDSVAGQNGTLGSINENVKRLLADATKLLDDNKTKSADELGKMLNNSPEVLQMREIFDDINNKIKTSTPKDKALLYTYQDIIEVQGTAIGFTYIKPAEKTSIPPEEASW